MKNLFSKFQNKTSKLDVKNKGNGRNSKCIANMQKAGNSLNKREKRPVEKSKEKGTLLLLKLWKKLSEDNSRAKMQKVRKDCKFQKKNKEGTTLPMQYNRNKQKQGAIYQVSNVVDHYAPFWSAI